VKYFAAMFWFIGKKCVSAVMTVILTNIAP